jgi:tRNA threonylcarbamoyladenosine biosynthesis protein TsaB
VLTLAFDTTSSALSIALLSDQKILTKNTIRESGKQSELLIPEIEKILREQKIWYQNLDLIATSHGPGSFTGTRIGLTAARTIKLATNLPLILVNSCEAAAFKHRERFGEIFVLLDAGMNEFFGAKFFAENKKLTEVLEPQLVRSEDLSAFLPKEKFFLCGSGKNLINRKKFLCEIVEEKDEIEADVIGLLALEKFRAGKISEDLNPIYLRAPRVTERKK